MKISSQALASFKNGLWDALPMMASYILSGTIYGMMALQAGLTSWESIAMSLFVYSGAAQFSAVSMIAEQASMWAILITTCLLNTRHLLMGVSISPYYQQFSRRQVNGLAFFLTDEQYAIALNRFRHEQSSAPYIVGVGVSLYVCWLVGTSLGTVAGQWIPDPASLGLGFSFIAMFLALAYYQLFSVARVVTFLLCGAAAIVFSILLPNGLHLLIAGIVAFLIGYMLSGEAKPDDASPSHPKEESA
ncbi:AzlC family ABC transporter permease [Brevibacillus sp. TJ4]|uniref:AzlC family ABC transporter permease n=1 Tax=Brevibacillus sp. TJ4 TaxID=3234853 RepID=UPI0037D0E679